MKKNEVNKVRLQFSDENLKLLRSCVGHRLDKVSFYDFDWRRECAFVNMWLFFDDKRLHLISELDAPFPGKEIEFAYFDVKPMAEETIPPEGSSVPVEKIIGKTVKKIYVMTDVVSWVEPPASISPGERFDITCDMGLIFLFDDDDAALIQRDSYLMEDFYIYIGRDYKNHFADLQGAWNNTDTEPNDPEEVLLDFKCKRLIRRI